MIKQLQKNSDVISQSNTLLNTTLTVKLHIIRVKGYRDLLYLQQI